MSNLRFNQVFTLLMIVSLVSAFVVPPRFTNPARAGFQGLFSPVSRPARAVAGIIYRRFHHDVPVDEGSPANPRPPQTILEENRQLRSALTMVSVKFEQLSRLNEDRQLVGENIRPLCTPATVTGTDSSGIRESLTISTAGFAGLKADLPFMPVVCANELVGKVDRAGIGGAQVRLITDPGFAFIGRIYRYRTDADGQVIKERVEALQPLVQGIGHGAMAIRSNISMAQVKEMRIAVDDMVVLDDRDWPANIQGFLAGHIKEIHPQQNAPLFADIRIEPESDLMRLREVMVMVKY